MAVAQMPRDAGQRQRVGGSDFSQRLRRGDHFHDPPVLKPQTVAAAQHRGLGEIEQELKAADASHRQAAAIALVEVEHHAVGRRA